MTPRTSSKRGSRTQGIACHARDLNGRGPLAPVGYAHKYPELAPDKRSAADLFIGSAANGQVILLRQGDECLWAEGVPAAQFDAMLDFLQAQ